MVDLHIEQLVLEYWTQCAENVDETNNIIELHRWLLPQLNIHREICYKWRRDDSHKTGRERRGEMETSYDIRNQGRKGEKYRKIIKEGRCDRRGTLTEGKEVKELTMSKHEQWCND